MLGTVFAKLYASARRACPNTHATARIRAKPDALDSVVPAAMMVALRDEDLGTSSAVGPSWLGSLGSAGGEAKALATVRAPAPAAGPSRGKDGQDLGGTHSRGSSREGPRPARR